jgi:5-methylcytosine-specific restriction endonuclease McrA
MRARLIHLRKGICGKCCNEIKDTIVMDHIKPIALGGAEFDINNLQLLCKVCNKIKTRQDAKDIAKQREVEKKLVRGQITLPKAV